MIVNDSNDDKNWIDDYKNVLFIRVRTHQVVDDIDVSNDINRVLMMMDLLMTKGQNPLNSGFQLGIYDGGIVDGIKDDSIDDNRCVDSIGSY